MNVKRQTIVVIIAIAAVACSRKGDESPSAGVPATDARSTSVPAPATPVAAAPEPEAPIAAPPEPEAPATLTDVNLVAADVGGVVEQLTGFYGPGLTGHRLIDGLPAPTWLPPPTGPQT